MSFDPNATMQAPTPTPSPGPTPSPQAGLRLQDLSLVALLGALELVLLPVLLPGTWIAYYALYLWLPLWVIGCATFGGALLGSREPLLVRVVRLTRHQFIEYGGGAYGAIALVCFGWLEWERLQEFITTLLAMSGIREFVRSLFDFGIDSFLNGIWAVAWPAFGKKVFGFGNFWPAAAIGWALFELTRWGAPRLPKRAAL